MIKELTKKTFDDFVSKGNAVIEYGAEWCGPCKIMEPHFKKAAEKLKDVKFGKVDVDAEYELASHYRIMSIPTTLFLKNGEVVDKNVGAMTADMIERKVNENFK